MLVHVRRPHDPSHLVRGGHLRHERRRHRQRQRAQQERERRQPGVTPLTPRVDIAPLRPRNHVVQAVSVDVRDGERRDGRLRELKRVHLVPRGREQHRVRRARGQHNLHGSAHSERKSG